MPYAITGALAASYYGRPRTTLDADILVRIRPRDYGKLVSLAAMAGLRADKTEIKSRLKAGYKVITLKDESSSLQADFILQGERRLDRRLGSLLGVETYYQSPESLILAKLRMVKATRPSERSLKNREDVQAILDNTIVDERRIRRLARAQSTWEVFNDIRKRKTVRKAGIDPEFRRVAERFLRKDRELLERLAKI